MHGALPYFCRHTPRLEVTEQTPINLALTVFEIDPVMRGVEVRDFAFMDAGDAEGAGDFLDGSKHCFGLSSFVL